MPTISNKIILEQFEPSLLDIEKKFEPILNQYGRMLADYTVNTTAIENEIEAIIATFFSIDETIKNDLIEFLITNMRFQKKIQILHKLLEQPKFKHLKTKKIIDVLKNIEKVFDRRNKLAHSIPIIHTSSITDRVGFKRGKNSKKQPIFISKEDRKKDKSTLLISLHRLVKLRLQIETIKT